MGCNVLYALYYNVDRTANNRGWMFPLMSFMLRIASDIVYCILSPHGIPFTIDAAVL
jgi:hypothetical protein